MTDEQKYIVEEYRNLYRENVDEYALYGSKRYCELVLKKNKDQNDKSITIAWNVINEIDNDGMPRTELLFINVLPEGNVAHLNTLLSFRQLNNYTKTLIDA